MSSKPSHYLSLLSYKKQIKLNSLVFQRAPTHEFVLFLCETRGMNSVFAKKDQLYLFVSVFLLS
jgi:hypothetical protein